MKVTQGRRLAFNSSQIVFGMGEREQDRREKRLFKVLLDKWLNNRKYVRKNKPPNHQNYVAVLSS